MLAGAEEAVLSSPAQEGDGRPASDTSPAGGPYITHLSPPTTSDDVPGRSLRLRSRRGSTSARGVVRILIAALATLFALALPSAALAAPPTLTINTPTGVETTKAHVTGEVSVPADANGFWWCFQYSEAGKSAWSPFCYGEQVNPGETREVEADFTTLKAGTEYEVRLAAVDNVEFFEGSEATSASNPTFTTDPAPNVPVLALSTPTASYTSAGPLQGTLDPEGGNKEASGAIVPIHWVIETSKTGDPGTWGETVSGDITEDAALGADPITVPESPAEAAGLAPDTTYHYRLRATYANIDVTTPDATFTTLPVAKPEVSDISITDVTADSVHFSAQVNPNSPEPQGSTNPAEQDAFRTSWHFECIPPGPSCGHHSGDPVEADNQPHEVIADASGLSPNTVYTVRLTASNAGGQVKATESFKTGPSAPQILSFEAGPVTATTAWLNGEVNPGGTDAVWWFEWGTEDCSQPDAACTSIPVEEDASAGSGPYYRWVDRQLTGLEPETTYHFRLVAKNGTGTVEGPDHQFTTPAPEPECPNLGNLGTAFLPNCRAYELVSPPLKEGGFAAAQSSRFQISLDGNSVTFPSRTAYADPKGAANSNQFLARRTGRPGSNGWDTHSIIPEAGTAPPGFLLTGNPFYVGAYTPDLRSGVFQNWRPLTGPSNVDTISNFYRIDGLDTQELSPTLLSDSFSPLPHFESPFDGSSLEFQKGTIRSALVGASTDLSHVVFEQEWNLTPDAPSQGGKFPGSDPTVERNFCEWAGFCEERLYDSVDGEVHYVGRVPQGFASECDDSPASATPCESAVAFPALRYFAGRLRTVSNDGDKIVFQAGGNVYIRENNQRTYKVNASEKMTPDEPQEAEAADISRDGTRVVFRTREQLVDDDTDGTFDAYLYDVTAPLGQRLTVVSGDSIIPAHIGNIIAMSDDGTFVYFTADGQLVAGQKPTPRNGLYVWHDGVIRLIGGPEARHIQTYADGQPNEFSRTRLSLDGRHLLFPIQSVTAPAFDGRGGYRDEVRQGREMVLAMYDYATGRITCTTCSQIEPEKFYASPDLESLALSGVSPSTIKRGRGISDDGRFTFFNSEEPLIAEDTNGVTDVYQFDALEDDLRLISSGTDDEPSYLLDSSATGRDVFFATLERLSDWDVDDSYDLYDARVGGGLPEPPPAPPICNSETCLGSVPAPPPSAAVASTSPGLGNPRPGCPAGKRKVKRKGKIRCLRRRRKARTGSGNHPRQVNRNRRVGK